MIPVRLVLGDLPACLALSVEAGWNQNERDWDFILRHGEAFGLRDGAALSASAAILPYPPRIAWICMVLVTASARRKGHASRLMQRCLERLDELGLIAGLDATAAGAEIYRRLGFEKVFSVTRFSGHGGSFHGGSAREPAAPQGVEIAAAQDDMLAQLAAYDAPRFGGDRSELLAALCQRAPRLALVARAHGQISGFALGREGRLSTQIGPVVASDPRTADALVAAALTRVSGPCLVDVPEGQGSMRALLEARGFIMSRGFKRMLRRGSPMPGKPSCIAAIAGPEFG